jgi:ankyrin repeat protein
VLQLVINLEWVGLTRELLTKGGRDLCNFKDYRNQTALFYAVAAQKSASELVELFLDNGVDVNILDMDGKPALIVAAEAPEGR